MHFPCIMVLTGTFVGSIRLSTTVLRQLPRKSFHSSLNMKSSTSTSSSKSMLGAVLPGNSTVQLEHFPVPQAGHGEVVIQTKCSTICGSDIRCIYRKYVGSDQEAYRPGTISGHEPAGVVMECGPGTRRFKPGDRVIVYHVSGCGICTDCRKGYMISCQSDEHRRSYGFQRHGGMAPYILAEEKVLQRFRL